MCYFLQNVPYGVNNSLAHVPSRLINLTILCLPLIPPPKKNQEVSDGSCDNRML